MMGMPEADGVWIMMIYHLLYATGCTRSVARAFSTAPPAGGAAPAAPAAPAKTHGNLKDEDRIFNNIYGRHDPFIKVPTNFLGS